jgi:hypothetical protein
MILMAKSTDEITKPRRLRPPETGTPVLVRLQAGPLSEIDEWRRRLEDLPSRAEAIRRLVAIGLKAKGRK